MPLTVASIQNAKSSGKTLKLFDGAGLFLLVTPSGGKWWRFKYRIRGKEKLLSLGVFPEVSLKEARIRRDKARLLLADPKDPSLERQLKGSLDAVAETDTFEAVAREWLGKMASVWSKTHEFKTKRLLEKDIFPWFPGRNVRTIVAKELLTVLRRIEDRGAIDTAHRAKWVCGQVLRYGVATGRAERDITTDLRGALTPHKAEHHPSVTEARGVGELLRAIAGYQGEFITRCALKLAPLVFVRPGELRRAEWPEFNLDDCEWRIAAARMKKRVQHIVPLSKQAVEILREVKKLTGEGKHVKYVFPGNRTKERPMSENTINAALRKLGYEKEQMTGHGFRSMASTLLNESGLWSRDAIERQLAHGEHNSVRAAYNYAELLPERRKMMQWWADHLDKLAKKKPK